MSAWSENPFWRDLVTRLAEQESAIDFAAVELDEQLDRWVFEPGGGNAPPAMLQGRRLVVDVTADSLLLYPLGHSGRFAVKPTFEAAGVVFRPTRMIYDVGRTRWAGEGWEIITVVSPTLPVVELELVGVDPDSAWLSTGESNVNITDEQWLTPADFWLDPIIQRNNSTIPDPLPLARSRAGVLARLIGSRVVLALAEDRAVAHAAMEEWEATRDHQKVYWDDVARRLRITTPDARLNRQAAYSVHSSLFSRSVDEDGHDIFLHGRRDRGYADTAHLHQSYQMHFVALAAGETVSVREELMAFLRLQTPTGWIERSPRPVAGSSTYVGRYTGAHLLLAAERYLSWTGDRDFFHERLTSRLDPEERTVFERVQLAADDLSAHRFRGLVAPCGWADAWNPEVRAQGQISAAAVLGLRAWADVCEHLGYEGAAATHRAAAAEIAGAMRDLLLDLRTGIVAEHVFDDTVTGGTDDDFWAHTQVWAALAGVADGRALDLVADKCFDHGIAIAPESAFEQEYIAASTDSEADLSVDSTATWLLARWPEVTHLYALAELERGRPDAALIAVVEQLPETLHGFDAVCAPWYYAEKYLYPGTRPWLCTWAGDPSFLEVLLSGFLGLHPSPAGLRIEPKLPQPWLGATSTATFSWRGTAVLMHLDPTLPACEVCVGGSVATGELISLKTLQLNPIIRVGTSQTIAGEPRGS